MIFLSMPFLPIARLIQFARLERLFYIGTDFMWHILDEMELL